MAKSKPDARRPDMTHSSRRLLLLALAIAAIAGLIWRYSRPQPIPVVLHTVTLGRVEASVANTRAGTVNACRRARITPSASGQVIKLLVHKGDRVIAGQLLLELWNEDARAQLHLAEQDATAAQARIEEACVQADNATREAHRQHILQDKKLVSTDSVERADTEAKARAASCRAARANAEVSSARIDAAHAALARTQLRAPFAGVVAELTGELGEFITPSPPGIPTPPAIDLVDDSCLYVTAPIDEVDAPRLKTGMPARITLDAFPGEHFSGHVRRVAPYVLDREKQARTVDVEVEFNTTADTKALLTGYSADVEIILETHDKVLRIPSAALLEGNQALVFNADDKRLHTQRIEAGLSNWEYTEVRSGLADGARVVTSLERDGVKEGAYVTVDTTPGSTDTQ